MKGSFASPAARASRSASMRACASSSMAQGPPIRTSGLPPPILTFPTITSRDPPPLARPAGMVLRPPVDEGGEERMRLPRPGAQLRVELAGHEPGMVGELDDLHELLLGPEARDPEAVLFQVLEVLVVHLEAVAVALLDDPLPVGPGGGAPLGEQDRVEPQPHGAALGPHGALLGEQVDDLVARAGVELRRVGVGQPADGPGELDDRALHPEADAEEGHSALAGVADGADLPLDAAVAETARDQDAVDPLEVRGGAVALHLLGVPPGHVHAGLVSDPAAGQRFGGI